MPSQPARLQGLCQSRRQVRDAHVSGWSPETLDLSHGAVRRTGSQPAPFLIGCSTGRVERLAQAGDSDRPRRTARPGVRLGRTQLAAVPGKGRGRVNSAGPDPHPGVTSPWPTHYVARGARVRRGAPAPLPGAVGVSRPTRPQRRLSRRRRRTRLTRPGLVDPRRHSDGRANRLGLDPVTRRARSKSASSSRPGVRPAVGRTPSRPGHC